MSVRALDGRLALDDAYFLYSWIGVSDYMRVGVPDYMRVWVPDYMRMGVPDCMRKRVSDYKKFDLEWMLTHLNY